MKRNIAAKRNNGFTLAELLIVIAIIAVLVAIAIPAFSSSQEKAKEAADLADIRSAYGEVMTNAIMDPDTENSKTVELSQEVSDWQTNNAQEILDRLGTVTGKPGKGGTCEVKWTGELCAITFDGSASGGGGGGSSSGGGSTGYYSKTGTKDEKINGYGNAVNKVISDLSVDYRTKWGQSFGGNDGYYNGYTPKGGGESENGHVITIGLGNLDTEFHLIARDGSGTELEGSLTPYLKQLGVNTDDMKADGDLSNYSIFLTGDTEEYRAIASNAGTSRAEIYYPDGKVVELSPFLPNNANVSFQDIAYYAMHEDEAVRDFGTKN